MLAHCLKECSAGIFQHRMLTNHTGSLVQTCSATAAWHMVSIGGQSQAVVSGQEPTLQAGQTKLPLKKDKCALPDASPSAVKANFSISLHLLLFFIPSLILLSTCPPG